MATKFETQIEKLLGQLDKLLVKLGEDQRKQAWGILTQISDLYGKQAAADAPRFLQWPPVDLSAGPTKAKKKKE